MRPEHYHEMIQVADMYNANRLKEFCEWFKRNNTELMLMDQDELLPELEGSILDGKEDYGTCEDEDPKKPPSDPNYADSHMGCAGSEEAA